MNKEEQKKLLIEIMEADEKDGLYKTNNMKLYTREQMIEAFNYGQNPKGFDWIGDMIDSLKPIELPSDKEIEEYANKYAADGAIINGAKWMKTQILNQNK